MAKKLTKAQLVSRLKKADIPVPKTAKVEDMQHRLDHWHGGGGFIVRLLKNPAHDKWEGHPVKLLKDKRILYWIPKSDLATEILEAKIVMNLGLVAEPSNDAQVIDVPLDYRMVTEDGSNDSANS